jgi:hypothetical protein
MFGSKSTVSLLALLVGATFILVGVLGFVPGITTNFSDLSFADHHSDSKLLGLFQVSVLHNVVHILFGLAGLALWRTMSGARTYLIGGGAIYLLLGVYGAAVSQHSDANFVPVNSADDVLHFALGAAMIALGFVGAKLIDGVTRRQATA